MSTPSLEHDACGVGFIVRIDGSTSHRVLEDAEKLSRRMVHRGASSADNASGDGAGVLIGMPHSYYTTVLREEQGLSLPPPGLFATGLMFLEPATAEASRSRFTDIAKEVSVATSLQASTSR